MVRPSRIFFHNFCHLASDKASEDVVSIQEVSNYLMRAPDTSPVEEGNPERKGMRNGAAGLLPIAYWHYVLESTAEIPDNSNLPLNIFNH